MKGFYLTVGLLQFTINFLMLCAVAMLMGKPCAYLRSLAAAAVGALYSVALTLWGGMYTGIWYGIGLLAVCIIAFGVSFSAAYSSGVFCLIKMGLEGMGTDNRLWWLLPVFAGLVLALVWQKKKGLYVPVELSYGGKTVKLMALRDTGHQLRDPVSGKAVLVVDSNVAEKLTGLSEEQLNNPVENIAKMVGLRLIPYRSVGCSAGFLLALSADSTKIAGNRTRCVVAMAPQVLDEEGKFQALMGGTL